MTKESSISIVEQKQLESIIDHVSNQTKYLNNDLRKQITLEQFL